MPRIKTAYRCPDCGSPMRVLRTRVDSLGRFTRYRSCGNGHKLTTREIPIDQGGGGEDAIGTTHLKFALMQMVKDLGISIDSDSPSGGDT